MPIVLNITAESAEELSQIVIELATRKSGASVTSSAPREERSIEDMLAELKAKLLPQNLTVVVKSKVRDQGSVSETETETANGAEPQPEAEKASTNVTSLPAAKKKASTGGQVKLSKGAAAEALSAETPAARKARCIAKLQALHSADKKAEVMKILADYGDGAKAFGAVPEANFAAISDALAAME
jgi:hypothetical protein